MNVVESKWYEMDMALDDVKKLLSANIKTMSRSFIAAGYYMKYIRDRELFRDGGYNSIWEFAEDQCGIKKSAASRWMAMNDKFSKDGNTPILDDKYKDFNKSQLQEMLYLTDEQIEETEPEMSAKEIRAIRKPPEVVAPAQQIDDQIPGQDSIDRHPEYMPEKMTIETATGQNRPPENEIPITPELQIERFFEALNRGDKERVLACDINTTTYLLDARYQDVRIRNGNFNYQANSTGIMFNPGSYMECAFTWNELAYELIKRFGKKRKSVRMVSIDAPEKPERKKNNTPEGCCQPAAETPDEKQQEHFVEDNKTSDHPGETTALPVMKNNDQRKEWLRNYKAWGLWYEDKNIGVKYYKYDFENGARLIAEEYILPGTEWMSEHETAYLHLVGGPEPEYKNGAPKWSYHTCYVKYPNSETELVEFLKELQK